MEFPFNLNSPKIKNIIFFIVIIFIIGIIIYWSLPKGEKPPLGTITSPILSLTPSKINPSGLIRPSVSCVANCDGKKVFFKEYSTPPCSGNQVSFCTISGSSCTGSAFFAPSRVGTHGYYACIDKNNDNDFNDSGEASKLGMLTVIASCTNTKPELTIQPSSQTGNRGKNLTYTLKIANEDSGYCDNSTFILSIESCPLGWVCKLGSDFLTLAKENAGFINLSIISSLTALHKDYQIIIKATNKDIPLLQETIDVIYKVI